MTHRTTVVPSVIAINDFIGPSREGKRTVRVLAPDEAGGLSAGDETIEISWGPDPQLPIGPGRVLRAVQHCGRWFADWVDC